MELVQDSVTEVNDKTYLGENQRTRSSSNLENKSSKMDISKDDEYELINGIPPSVLKFSEGTSKLISIFETQNK